MQIQTQIAFIRCFRRIFDEFKNNLKICCSHNPGTLRSESKVILTGTETFYSSFYLNAGAFTNLNIDSFFNYIQKMCG